MRKSIGAVLLIALFSGCSLFGVFNQAETGLDLSERSEQQLKDAEIIIDSLVVELEKCQQSNSGKQRIKSF